MKFVIVMKILDFIHDILCPFFRDKDVKTEDKPKDSKDNQ